MKKFVNVLSEGRRRLRMKKFECYLAGASAEPDITVVERYMALLREAGHVITFDWTKAVRAVGNGSPPDKDVRSSAAITDLQGVERCQIFWLLQPSNQSTGAWVELGHALAFKKVRSLLGTKRPIIIVSGATERCIFADEHPQLVDYRFANSWGSSHELALAQIGRLAEEA